MVARANVEQAQHVDSSDHSPETAELFTLQLVMKLMTSRFSMNVVAVDIVAVAVAVVVAIAIAIATAVVVAVAVVVAHTGKVDRIGFRVDGVEGHILQQGGPATK